MDTSMSLKYLTREGKNQSRSFSHINPNATNAEIKSAAQSINALSTNTYVATTRIDKTDCDEPDKQIATASFNPSSMSKDEIRGADYKEVSFTYDGDADPSLWQIDYSDCRVYVQFNRANKNLHLYGTNTTAGTITIYFPSTEIYKSASATFTIT